MTDDKLFFHLESHYGVFNLDARYMGIEHAAATHGLSEAESLDADWVSTTFADLSDADNTLTSAYMAKAVTAGCRSVHLIRASTQSEWWHQYVVKRSRYIYFLRGEVAGHPRRALAVVEYSGVVKGSPLIASWDTALMVEPEHPRLAVLKRRAATASILTR